MPTLSTSIYADTWNEIIKLMSRLFLEEGGNFIFFSILLRLFYITAIILLFHLWLSSSSVFNSLILIWIVTIEKSFTMDVEEELQKCWMFSSFLFYFCVPTRMKVRKKSIKRWDEIKIKKIQTPSKRNFLSFLWWNWICQHFSHKNSQGVMFLNESIFFYLSSGFNLISCEKKSKRAMMGWRTYCDGAKKWWWLGWWRKKEMSWDIKMNCWQQ